MTDQPNNESESRDRPESVDETDAKGEGVKVEADEQDASASAAVSAEPPAETLGGDTESEPVEDTVEQQEAAGEAVAVDEGRPEPDESEETAVESVTEQAEEPEDMGDEPADEGEEEEPQQAWYILKVQVNREDSIRDALLRRIKIEGVEESFGEIVVPTEDVAEFNKSGKRRVVKKKLYPGYILVNMAINDDTWFLVRETPGVGDFTGSAGKPTPMEPQEVERILKIGAKEEDGGNQIKTAIPFRTGDRVRVKDGYFQNFEGDVEGIDEANGRITVMINIFGRSTPVELEHWQVEAV